jgi:ceramide glucosyltransferase
VLAQILLAIAVAGTLSSAVFLFLALLGARKFHQDAARQQAQVERHNGTPWPPVSVLKPVHGMEPHLEENLESFYRQDYPRHEVLFAARHDDDPALAVARRVAARYPHVRTTVLAVGEPPWPNPPAYSFHHMTEAASSDILVTSDSDVRVASNYLRQVVAPLLEEKVGLVTCVYRGVNTGGLWSGLDAIGMSVEMTAGVLVANLLEGMKFALGPTIATRKGCVERIGGFRALGEYFANDFVIGNLVAKLGYTVVLSQHIIEHVVPPMDAGRMWQRLLRWARSTRYSRPKGHLGTGLVFAMPFGLLGLAAGSAAGYPLAGWALFAAAVLNRMIESWVIGWGVVRDPVARRSLWLYPVRDLLGFVVWVASYLRPGAVWRENRYQLVAGGKIVMRQNARERMSG